SSKEMERYRQYGEQWNSFDPATNKNWLEALNYDLNSAMDRLEFTPANRYPALGLGAIENETGVSGPISVRLGIRPATTAFQTRLLELCRRVQISMQFKCFDAAAFLLRKILEVCTIERFRREKRLNDISVGGRTLGLEDLLGKASRSAKGYVKHKTIEALLKEKLVLDTAVHDANYDPMPDDLYRVMAIMNAALQDLTISEL